MSTRHVQCRCMLWLRGWPMRASRAAPAHRAAQCCLLMGGSRARARAPVALVLARYCIGMLVGGVAVLWVAAWYYLRKPRGALTL